jgi:RNA polymerase sigma factor (sigma-70 family)
MPLALSATHAAPTCSEHDLIAAVRRGDDRAFEVLYSRYHRRIVSYINGMVGDHARAEDIAQDVFISVLRRLRANDRPIVFKPWLYEVAKNACIDEFRRARRGREVPLERDDDLIGGNPRLVSRSRTPEAEIEGKQRLTDLRGAFRGLSESHHKVIVMRELEGLSYAQIGAELGMSQAVVESTLFRARRRLGEEYEDLVSGRRCDHVRAVVGEGDARAMRSLGLKQRRLVARHLSHCQECRRHAKLAGVDESLFEQPGLVGKIAALLPIPAWLRLRRGATPAVPSHSINLIQSAQGLAATNPTAVGGISRAAAAAVTLMIAGAGTGIVSLGAIPGSSARPASHTAPAAAVTRSGARRASSGASRATPHRKAVATHGGAKPAPSAVGRRSQPASRSSASSAGAPSVSATGGRRAGVSGSGNSTSSASAPVAKGGTGAGSASGGTLHGAPTVTIPAGIKLPNVLTGALPGLVKATHLEIPAPITAGSPSLGGGGGGTSGRGGTASNAPGPLTRAVEALGGG